jgi:peptidoglycan/xylan/chitin deacetylase (PgdA/CDA1 family)
MLNHSPPICKIPILTFHSIDNSGSVVSVSPTMFEKQMSYLYNKGYKTISSYELIEKIKLGKNIAAKEIVLTFDDGFRNNKQIAYPILKRYGFTATIFITTGYIGGKCSWNRDNTIPELPMLSWEEIEQLHQHHFDIQPHSCTHTYLTRLTDDEACQEIIVSKEEVESRLNKSCDVFCYPYGDFDERIMTLVKQAGFLGAVTIEFGRLNIKEDIFCLKRLGSACFADSIVRFKASLSGIFDTCLEMKRWLSSLI